MRRQRFPGVLVELGSPRVGGILLDARDLGAQARQARIEAQLIGCEIEELADHLRRTNAAWPLQPQASRRALAPHLFVFSG